LIKEASGYATILNGLHTAKKSLTHELFTTIQT